MRRAWIVAALVIGIPVGEVVAQQLRSRLFRARTVSAQLAGYVCAPGQFVTRIYMDGSAECAAGPTGPQGPKGDPGDPGPAP